MSAEEIINSGLLELYAMGACTKEESLQVEECLRLYPQVKSELNQIETALEQTAMLNAVKPSVQLKQNIKSKLTFNEPVLNTTQQNSETTELPSESKELTIKPRLVLFYKVSLAASLVISCLLGYLSWHYKQALNNSLAQLATLTQQSEVLADKINRANYTITQFKNDLEIIGNSDFSLVALSSVKTTDQSNAKIYWNKKSHETYIQATNLPDLSSEKQFQLWAIVDGKPIDAGVFSKNEVNNLIKLNLTKNAQMFAITVEPKGGSATPTLSEMVVAGKVNS